MTPLDVKTPKEYDVRLVERSVIKDFVEKWHYSKSINGLISDYCFGLYFQDELIGACIYGRLAMANVWKKYGSSIEEVTELRRLCLIDNTVRNSESYFIAQTIKYLQKNTRIKTIISYADTFYNHQGIIYQASNFEKIGCTKPCRKIKYKDKLYHDKAIRTKYKGELKPFAKNLKESLENGEAVYIKTPEKIIYKYELKRK